MKAVREGKSYAKIRFTLTKTAARDDRDAVLQDRARRGRAFAKTPATALGMPYQPTDEIMAQLLKIAPVWEDRHMLLAQYREWTRGKAAPANPHGAFIGFAKGLCDFV
jgi:hypothetical protein